MSDEVTHLSSRKSATSHTTHDEKPCLCSNVCIGDRDEQTSIDGNIQNVKSRPDGFKINNFLSHWNDITTTQRSLQSNRKNPMLGTVSLLSVCTGLSRLDGACSTTKALQSGKLYGSKSTILLLTKLFLFTPDKYESRRASKKMQKEDLFELNISK